MQSVPSSDPTSHVALPGRLGFVVMVGEDGLLPEDVLIHLRNAGYTGIEPNCCHPQHFPPIIKACRNVGLAIYGIPTGRWMNVASANDNYAAYMNRAMTPLREGALIAADCDAPLILGLIRGTAAIAPSDAEQFLTAVTRELIQQTPNLRILIEPIASLEASWPHRQAEGAHLLRTLALPQVKMLADSYHIVQSGEVDSFQQYANLIGHLHIRDQDKQIPTQSAPEYDAIMRVWQERDYVLSFEPAIDLAATVTSARAGAQWIRQELARLGDQPE